MEKRMNQAMRSRRAGQRGFTLIELLVVIAVLAVLAAVVVFNVTGVKDKGSSAACSTDVKSVQSAYDAYINDGGVATGAGAFAPASL
jgi:prepilin-type N-terminal cleavage/methylation domain-containing protein